MTANRYCRQEQLLGKKEQARLRKCKVIIVGCGGLGSAAAELLLRSGVEHLTLIDDDKIEMSNLGRQLLYGEKDIGKFKAMAAKRELLRINSKAQIKTIIRKLGSNNLASLNSDLVLDCTDNLETRFWINAYCHKQNIPWIYASAIRWEGYVMLISKPGPCLSCFLRKSNNETCTQHGIISTLPASIAALQASLAIKYLTGEKTEPLLYHLNLKTVKLDRLRIRKNEKCVTCGRSEG